MSAPAQVVSEVTKDVMTQLFPVRFKQSEFERTVWVATTEGGTKREHLNNPAFWAHVAVKLKPYDHIEVRCDDESFWAEYLVLAADRTWAKVHELRFVELNKTTQGEAEDPDYKVQWKGPHRKFAVVRISDSAVLQEDFSNRPDAETWIKSYRVSMSR